MLVRRCRFIHQELSINVSVANNSAIIKKVEAVKKSKADDNIVDEKESILKVIKDVRDKRPRGICYMNLTSVGCQYGKKKCNFNHFNPKPNEYGAVKQFWT